MCWSLPIAGKCLLVAQMPVLPRIHALRTHTGKPGHRSNAASLPVKCLRNVTPRYDKNFTLKFSWVRGYCNFDVGQLKNTLKYILLCLTKWSWTRFQRDCIESIFTFFFFFQLVPWMSTLNKFIVVFCLAGLFGLKRKDNHRYISQYVYFLMASLSTNLKYQPPDRYECVLACSN